MLDPFLEGDRGRGISPGVVPVKDLSDPQVVTVTHAARDHAAQAMELMKMSRATLFSPVDGAIKATSPEKL